MVRSAGFFVAFLALIVNSVPLKAQDPTINPAKGYDVKSYNATIWLNRQKDSISGWVEMSAIAMGGLPQILQDAKFLQIDSVFVDGKRSTTTTPDSNGSYNIIGYPNTYQNGSEFTTKTYYHGKCTNEGGSYAWGGVQNMGNMMFAMGVGFNTSYVSCTRHWLPCYDEPDDKADSVTLNFYADTSGIVVSNGLQNDYKAGTDNGTTNYFQWKITHPIATYLLTFAFGPFEKLTIANPLNIPFDVYAFPNDTAKLRMLIQKRVVPALVFFDSLFGKYPFEKVGYVVAPIGSMEHQTMITLVNSALDTNNTTAVHELSHQWWGDRTTCYDFNDPWLNEGFATFCESLFQERFFGEAQYLSRQHSNISSALAASEDMIPLFAAPAHTKPRNNYPPVIYNKGAAVLGMLRYALGDEAFFDALRTYGNLTAYSTATTEDLENIFEDTTHEDLRMFFIEWVFGIGHPVLSVTWSKNGGTINMMLTQTQDSAKIGFFRHPIVVETRASGG
ncbi:MAG: M1 family metallopeptidase, partial [Candidatus Kapaibacterium sp.]